MTNDDESYNNRRVERECGSGWVDGWMRVVSKANVDGRGLGRGGEGRGNVVWEGEWMMVVVVNGKKGKLSSCNFPRLPPRTIDGGRGVN